MTNTIQTLITTIVLFQVRGDIIRLDIPTRIEVANQFSKPC